MSEKEVFDIVSKHGIIPMKSRVDNYKKLLEETYKEYPELTRYKEEDFEIKDKEEFLKSINNKNSFNVHCVEFGVKHPVKNN
jgi:protein-arginine kinase